LLEWQYEMLALDYEQHLDITTQLQLLRVTKEMQIKLKNRENELLEAGHGNGSSSHTSNSGKSVTGSGSGGSGDGKAGGLDLGDRSDKLTAVLERKMEFARSAVRQLNLDKQAEMMKITHKIKKIERENARLAVTVQQLTEAVDQRKAINELRDASEEERKMLEKRRMKNLVNRRKLTELSKLQSEEIAWLREQVESLRKRTFASFASATIQRGEEEKIQMNSSTTKSKGKRFNKDNLILPPV